MGSEWREVTLGELIQVKHGWPFKSEEFSIERKGRPIVVSIGNFQYSGGFRFESTSIKEYQGDYPRQYELNPGDILLVMTCQTAGGEILGIPARVPSDGNIYLHNQRLGLVSLQNSNAELNFLYWLFLSPEFNRHLFLTATGTKILHTAPSRIESFRFFLPPLSEQKAIAHILGSLDDKIELNRKQNATLEAMAQALFQSWFVDFDPVIDKALAAGNEIPEPLQSRAARRAALGNRRKPLPAEIEGLFPDRFVETEEMGWVPEGWGVVSFSEQLEATRGFSYKGEGLREAGQGIPMYNLNSVYEGGGLKYQGIKYYEGDYKEKHTIKARDIIVANTEQGHKYLLIGCPAIIPNQVHGDAIFSHHIYRVRPLKGSPVTPQYAYYMILNPKVRDQIIGYCNGTTVNMLKIDGLQKPSFILASSPTIQSFSQTVESFWEQKEVLHESNTTLTQLRDTLLPKLISGEIRVGDVEDLIGYTARGH